MEKIKCMYMNRLWQDEKTGDGLFSIDFNNDDLLVYARLPLDLEYGVFFMAEIDGNQMKNVSIADDNKIKGRNKSQRARYEEKLRKWKAILEAIADYPELPVELLEKAYGKFELGKLDKMIYHYDLPFWMADKVAKNHGISHTDTDRVKGACLAAMDMIKSSGHTWYGLVDYLHLVQNLLGEPKIALSWLYLLCPKWIKLDYKNEVVYEKNIEQNEESIARNIRRLSMTTVPDAPDDVITQAETVSGITLGTEQKEAVKGLLSTPMGILTGDPGTGKTTCIKVLLTAYESLYPDHMIKLAAPTGRAAQRIAETTGRDAETIHRMLKYHSLGDRHFCLNENDPLKADLVIIDETSMVDIELCSILLKAMQNGTRVIFIGDHYQLPSVGCGNVLSDLIESEIIPHYHLTKIYRQAEGSIITENARKIKNGISDLKSHDDCQLRLAKTEEQMAKAAIAMVKKNPDIQVMIPVKKGVCSTYQINRELQNVLNPKTKTKTEITYAGKTFREGDKVIFTHNEPNEGYMNGDMGYIGSIIDGIITVITAGDVIKIDRGGLKDLDLAYAITIHKSQGSEFSTGLVLLPYTSRSKRLLQRNLLYTALTRCKEKAIIIAMDMEENGNSLTYAIENTGETRKTRLKNILKKSC